MVTTEKIINKRPKVSLKSTKKSSISLTQLDSKNQPKFTEASVNPSPSWNSNTKRNAWQHGIDADHHLGIPYFKQPTNHPKRMDWGSHVPPLGFFFGKLSFATGKM